MNKLSRNTYIIILRQHKDRGVTILDHKDYIKKCVSMLNTSQFQKLDTAPTKSLERKVQWILQKIKRKFEENEYKKLYPKISRLGLFHVPPKVHKI